MLLMKTLVEWLLFKLFGHDISWKTTKRYIEEQKEYERQRKARALAKRTAR